MWCTVTEFACMKDSVKTGQSFKARRGDNVVRKKKMKQRTGFECVAGSKAGVWSDIKQFCKPNMLQYFKTSKFVVPQNMEQVTTE